MKTTVIRSPSGTRKFGFPFGFRNPLTTHRRGVFHATALACVLGCLPLAAVAQPTAPAAHDGYGITDRGAFWRTWKRTVPVTDALTGAVSNKVEQYQELENGIAYQDPQNGGQWTDSQDLVEITPTGAAGVHGPVKANFAPNLNTANAITLTTAAGQTFQSHPIGLYYRDMASGKVALVAAVQDTTGVLVPPNTVVHSNAFSGLAASIVYIYAHNGFDQSVVLEQAPPPPDLLAGFSPDTTRLEMWTALDSWPMPQGQRNAFLKKGGPPPGNPQGKPLPDLVDQLLFFQDTWMPVGAAFNFGDPNQPAPGEPAKVRIPSPSDTNNVLVAKSIVQIDNHSVLIESVNYTDILPKLQTLKQAALQRHESKISRGVAQGHALPAPSAAQARPLKMASAGTLPHGVLLDYITCPSSAGDYSFAANTTYYIPNSFYSGGSVTFGNNCVIKPGANTYLLLYGPVTFPNSGAPVICTSMNDNSVGDTISGSTGILGYTAAQALWLYYETRQTTVQNANILWAWTAIEEDESSGVYNYPSINNVYLQSCNVGVYVNVTADTLYLSGITYCNVGTPIYDYTGYYSGTASPYCAPGFALYVPLPAPSAVNTSGATIYPDYSARPVAPAGAASTPPTSPGPSANFSGPADNDTLAPPDTQGAVGLNEVMTILNTGIQVQSRTGGILQTNTRVGFWNQNNNLGTFYTYIVDPQITYDPYNNRWIACATVNYQTTNSAILIAISKTSSATNGWYTHSYPADSTGARWADHPTLGFNNKWIVVQANMITMSGAFDSSFVYVYNKANLYAGNFSNPTQFTVTGRPGIMPAVTYDNALGTFYLAESVNGNSGGWGYLGLYSITGAVGSEQWNGTSIPTYFQSPNTWTSPASHTNFGPQSGITNRIDMGDDRINSLVYRNGSLWCAQTVFLPTSSPTRTAVQWFQLNPAGSGISGIIKSGRIDDPNGVMFYSYPSIAVNKFNDLLLGFSTFSANQYASAAYAFRPYTAQDNSFDGTYTL